MGSTWTGHDCRSKAARRTRNPADKVQFTVADLAGLPLPDGCADPMAHEPA